MGGPKKKIRMETVTTSKITKTVSKTSVLRQTVQRETGGRESHLRENQIVAKGESCKKTDLLHFYCTIKFSELVL